jgi:hypothetical protein
MLFTKMYNVGKVLFGIIAMLLLALQTYAQDPGDRSPTATDSLITENLLDGLVSLLLAGGAVLGLNKLRIKNRK